MIRGWVGVWVGCCRSLQASGCGAVRRRTTGSCVCCCCCDCRSAWGPLIIRVLSFSISSSSCANGERIGPLLPICPAVALPPPMCTPSRIHAASSSARWKSGWARMASLAASPLRGCPLAGGGAACRCCCCSVQLAAAVVLLCSLPLQLLFCAACCHCCCGCSVLRGHAVLGK